MKNLYHRIVATTVLVMILSSSIAFLTSNLYYQYKLKSYNDSKVAHMAEQIKHFYEDNGELPLAPYLDHIGKLGYQFYLVDEQGQDAFYGQSFRKTGIDPGTVRSVLEGQTYHGITEFPTGLFITGFFDNDLRNTIGVPLHRAGEPAYALFLRPNAMVQFGEMRTFFAIILVVSILLSIILVAFSTRYMVKPIVKLTEATKMLARGKYNIKLDVKRDDEIGKLAVNFAHMAKSLEQLEAMRQEFVSNVSHEIQSPLASIQGFSHTLLTADLPEEQRRHYLSIIEDESRRISQLSKQLLTLASLEKEETILEKGSLDVGAQIKQVLFMTEWSWREKELAIKMDLPSLFIQADSKLLHQVWINLITNSIKFTEEGGTISVRLRPDGKEYIAVEIADTGIGISESDLPNIFQRFYRADKSRNRKEGSSGLGLAIVEKIIEMHGGEIQVESEPGKGTQFRIRLPIH
ncbi:HAMP domain-containing sensor histidine kinase [Paenibacillus vini]|uniref:sensor histidine kinase n=1 Tax=Paenibacillus vini TaxID=1476024 RepID=UPI0025B727DE|nr:HAMP domain-containing sensor histidine kinase [Paenibacillus vini]MDN4069663.1 HAMP domain-containing sensor histidine kinase [Paenibacillus vini]